MTSVAEDNNTDKIQIGSRRKNSEDGKPKGQAHVGGKAPAIPTPARTGPVPVPSVRSSATGSGRRDCGVGRAA